MRHRLNPLLLLAVIFSVFLASSGTTWGQAKLLRVGLLTWPLMKGTARDESYEQLFVRALSKHGWREGSNVAFEYRAARGDPPQFGASAAELVKLHVDVIYANNAPAVRAAYEATRTIPIVGLDFTNDPVAAGYAESYARPGHNLTGVFLDAPEFAGKWLENIKALVPRLSRVAVLWDPSPGNTHLKAVQGASRSLGLQLQVLEVRTPSDIDAAFAKVRAGTQALVILPSPMTVAHGAQLANLALQYRLPATSMSDVFAETGGLLAYGPDLGETFDRCASLVSQILSGANPGELPVARPTKVPLIINLKTANALGLTVPESILVSADRVIK